MRPNIKLSSNVLIQQRLKEITQLYGDKTWAELLSDLILAGDRIMYEKLADGYRHSRVKLPLSERAKMLKILVEDLLDSYEDEFVNLNSKKYYGKMKLLD